MGPPTIHPSAKPRLCASPPSPPLGQPSRDPSASEQHPQSHCAPAHHPTPPVPASRHLQTYLHPALEAAPDVLATHEQLHRAPLPTIHRLRNQTADWCPPAVDQRRQLLCPAHHPTSPI